MYILLHTRIHTSSSGQAGGVSFKFETLIAYRAEQRLCL